MTDVVEARAGLAAQFEGLRTPCERWHDYVQDDDGDILEHGKRWRAKTHAEDGCPGYVTAMTFEGLLEVMAQSRFHVGRIEWHSKERVWEVLLRPLASPNVAWNAYQATPLDALTLAVWSAVRTQEGAKA